MKAFWSRLARLLSDMPIRRKLLISYLLFIAVPLVLFSTISYLAVARYYEDQVWYSASQAFDQAFTFLSSKVNALVKASDVVYFSREVQTALTRNRAEFEGNFIQQSIDATDLDNYLSSFRNTDDVYRISLFVPGWLSYSRQGQVFENLDAFLADPARADFLQSRDKVVWVPGETVVSEYDVRASYPVVAMYRRIRDYNDLSATIGVIRIVLLQAVVDAVVAKASTTRSALVFIASSDGQLVSASDPQAARPWLASLGRGAGTGPVWSDAVVAGRAYSFRKQALPNTDFSLVSAIPVAEIRYQSDRLRDLLVLLVLGIGAAAYFAAALLTRSTTQRLNNLTAAMDRLGDVRAPVTLPFGGRDEIGVLTESFREMAGQIRSLLDAQYQAGQDLKTAELRALQAQINPHFLYNTLELINWQALNKGAPEIAELSRALARFYALSLNNGRDIVTLDDELAHVATYVDIQNRRFEQRIRLVVQVPQAYRDRPLLKTLLQPLVENAILHGILERGEKASGTVTISARRARGEFHLQVADDGVGIEPDRLSRLLSGPGTQEKHGYGVKNINERVRLYYGEPYGLVYRSHPGRGTTVVIRLPQR